MGVIAKKVKALERVKRSRAQFQAGTNLPTLNGEILRTPTKLTIIRFFVSTFTEFLLVYYSVLYMKQVKALGGAVSVTLLLNKSLNCNRDFESLRQEQKVADFSSGRQTYVMDLALPS